MVDSQEPAVLATSFEGSRVTLSDLQTQVSTSSVSTQGIFPTPQVVVLSTPFLGLRVPSSRTIQRFVPMRSVLLDSPSPSLSQASPFPHPFVSIGSGRYSTRLENPDMLDDWEYLAAEIVRVSSAQS